MRGRQLGSSRRRTLASRRQHAAASNEARARRRPRGDCSCRAGATRLYAVNNVVYNTLGLHTALIRRCPCEKRGPGAPATSSTAVMMARERIFPRDGLCEIGTVKKERRRKYSWIERAITAAIGEEGSIAAIGAHRGVTSEPPVCRTVRIQSRGCHHGTICLQQLVGPCATWLRAAR